ncbi:MAG: hypothetical protein A4E63_00582 [Syntrophorhabdus sp. PtaU1.Bin050]|nr:MAG: hypothetical protein A4E63_00582 [Syntrophorhabdus sp. PtaU1.Bin050]
MDYLTLLNGSMKAIVEKWVTNYGPYERRDIGLV